MIVISLQSGSKGNCIYVETDDARLLFDAGISGKQAQERLAAFGRDVRDVTAVVISHEHDDHIRSMGIFQRKFGLTAAVTEKTLRGANVGRLGKLGNVVHFTAGQCMHRGATSIQTFRTAHDAVDGVAFVVDDGRRRFGLFTDLGHPFRLLSELLPTLDGVLIESNYDPAMLRDGPYPRYLQERIRGPRGHLSNEESAELLRTCGAGRLQWCCLGHLSENNNRPDIAEKSHRRLLGETFPLCVAPHRKASRAMELA